MMAQGRRQVFSGIYNISSA